MPGSLGNWLIFAGIILVVIGLIAKTGLLGWFGQLPGDIAIKRENFQVFLPLTSMIIVSITLSLVIGLLRRLF
jgi:hypothetical protein